MPRLRLLPFDPSAALLASVAAVIRSGVAGWDQSPQPQPAWTGDAACPASHFLCPTGARLYIDREPTAGVQCTPAVILFIPDDAKEKSPEIRGAWALGLHAAVRTHKDADLPDAESIIKRLIFLLSHPLILTDTTTQQPQTRLSTATLHVFGSHYRDNFEEIAYTRVQDIGDHPQFELYMRITCALCRAS